MESKITEGTVLRTIYSGLKSLKLIWNIWYNETPNYNERLYLGNVSWSDLSPNIHWEGVYRYCEKYLVDGCILTEEFTNALQGHSKAVGLAHDYFLNGKFDNPICTHWNPRKLKPEIHPGGSRTTIIELFNSMSSVDTYYFSTYGKTPDWLTTFQQLDIEYFEKRITGESEDMNISFTADHGTLIPHITVNGGGTTESGIQWHKKCREVLDTQKIWLNTEVEILQLFKKTSDKNLADKVIYIKDTLSIKDLLRLSILVFLNYEWEDSKIKIIPKNPTPSAFK